MVCIVDLGLSNVDSVSRALDYLGVGNIISDRLSDIRKTEKIILPGVGNFFEASRRLHSSGLADVLKEEVLLKGKPFLGICLGMQLMATFGEEGGSADGLGFIDGRVRRLPSEKKGFRLPHIGWNDLTVYNMTLFDGIERDSCFYFVHSFALVLTDRKDIDGYATCDYGGEFTAAVKKKNLMAAQFHPEKSQRAGLRFLSNFVKEVY